MLPSTARHGRAQGYPTRPPDGSSRFRLVAQPTSWRELSRRGYRNALVSKSSSRISPEPARTWNLAALCPSGGALTTACASVKGRLAEANAAPTPLTAVQFGKHIAAETENWGKVARAVGIKAD
jgi:hypothetical protein